MAEGNRKDPRARVLNMTVRYKSATVDEFIENHSHDISRGGIFIKTRSPFPAGTLLKFEVRIAEDQRLMQGVGRVVWRREPERAEEGFPAGMGIKFIKIGDGAAELIGQIVAARQGAESSFDAGARDASLSAVAASRRDGDAGERRSPVPALIEANSPPPEAPAVQVESGAFPMPAEREIHISSPPKKRRGQSETRKVVVQGTASEATASDRAPASAPVALREVPASERAPSRPAPGGERSSIAEEITAPRARASEPERRPGSSSPYGLLAILAAICGVAFLVHRARTSEPSPSEPTPASMAPEASSAERPAPPPAAAAAPAQGPSAPQPASGAAEGTSGTTAVPATALHLEPPIATALPTEEEATPAPAPPTAAARPSAPPAEKPSVPRTPPRAAAPTAQPASPTAVAAKPKPSVAAAEASSAAAAPSTKPAAAASAAAPKAEAAPPAASAQPQPPAPSETSPAGAAKPAPAAKPGDSEKPAESAKPSDAEQPAEADNSAGAAQKSPPAAPAAPPSPTPAAPPASDDNPY